MHLITPYAPPTFLKPVIIVSTIANDKSKQTAVCFVNSLNIWHALETKDHLAGVLPGESEFRSSQHSNWSVIQNHQSKGQALEFHLQLTEKLSHGTEEEWEAGYPVYLELYEAYCPVEWRDKFPE